MELSQDHLLGGRVAFSQPRHGFRSGIEPVLLAASVPPDAGRVLDAGTGAGAALLCLGARLPGVAALGLERSADLAALAAANAARNGWSGRIGAVAGNVLRPPFAPGSFDQVISNPPYHLAAGTPSPIALRSAAKQASPDFLRNWIGACASLLRPRGGLTLVLPAASHAAAIAALAAAGCGAIDLHPLWPRVGVEAKLLLLRGRKGARGPGRVLPGLVLHAGGGAFTPEATRVLREGAGLRL